MDLLSKWSQRMREYPFPTTRGQIIPVPDQVRSLVQENLQRWWACERSLPQMKMTYLPKDQAANEKQLETLTDGLLLELKRIPQDPQARQEWQERLRPGMVDFARTALNLEPRHIEFIESSGMIEASRSFARMAREFDSKISAEDIYQAGRNVMTANLIQLLLGLPVEVTPAIFAYSMLYPYTDNYLDDPAVSRNTKLAFNNRFQRRLQGEEVRPANAHEAAINRLVGMIEGQWERGRFPQVYDSLLAIHAAQVRSLTTVVPGAAPYELDILGISFEKGGASVLADGYLVAGWLSPEQAACLFGYGCFTQLMDDLEDIPSDLREGRMTVFSQTAHHWTLDGLTNRFLHFGRAVFSDLNAFPAQASSALSELIDHILDPLLIDTISRAGRYYSKDYLREMERHMPFRFDSLKRQRDRLNRQKVTLGSLVDSLI